MNQQKKSGYTQVVNFETDEYTSRIAKTLKEAYRLMDAGFDFSTKRMERGASRNADRC